MNDPTTSGPESRPAGYPAALERTWRAPDGTTIRFRPMVPGDLDREMRFIRELSERTLYLRRQFSAREVSRDEAARLLDLDYRDRIAVAALVGTPPMDEIVGVSRYARIEGTDRAECAIVVADAWQARGIGTELMRSLAHAARVNGITRLEGTSLAENERIRAWARRFGFDVKTEAGSSGHALITIDPFSVPS